MYCKSLWIKASAKCINVILLKDRIKSTISNAYIFNEEWNIAKFNIIKNIFFVKMVAYSYKVI